MGVTKVRAIFSDLDGTLCHFDRDTRKHGVVTEEDPSNPGQATVRNTHTGETRGCRLLPTSTMGNGVVSEETVRLVDELRKAGVIFVVVSGARSSTIMKRLPLLPHVDAAVSETGSRVMYAPEGGFAEEGANIGEAMALDTDWAKRFEGVTGPLDAGGPAEERKGTLWDLFRELQAMGLSPDAKGYTGCFRVDCQSPESVEKIRTVASDAEGLSARGLAHAMNLGKYDFFPAVAGKGNTVLYLMHKWGLRPDECVALFDDDNDLPMAQACGAGMLPGVTSESVQARLGQEPDWTLADAAGTGVFATEEILQRLLKHAADPGSGGGAPLKL